MGGREEGKINGRGKKEISVGEGEIGICIYLWEWLYNNEEAKRRNDI